MIGDFLDNIHDLSNLARVNQPFYRVFNRLLYKAAVEDHHPGPTSEAASNGNLGAVKLAAEHSANLDYYQIKPLTADEKLAKSIPYQLSPRARWRAPLHFAIIYGHQHVVEWLISKGVDIEAPARLYCGCESPWNDITPYHESYRTDYDKGVMVWTPLHYAICHRQTDIAHLLLSAALKLVEGGTPIWSREEVWDRDIDSFEKVETPIALLTEVLAGWDYESPRTNTRFCGLTDKCCAHDEHEIAAKKKSFLKLAQRTVDEVPHEVSTYELKDILARGLIAIFDHADFCDEDFSEYVKIIRPALDEDAIGDFRQLTLSLLVDHKTRDYEFAQMRGITFLLDDLCFDCLIRTMELLRVQGAWKDAREQPGRLSTEEKSSWSLAGTIVEGENCPELSAKWNKIRSDELEIIPSKYWHIFKKIRWESQ
ncbi:hypothetical protein K4K57_004758 [Colletotrichum sp. SAR 10_99]|nr:hypothetical protein K4K55_005853 [Colletotrichum sp. SAR 10_96]KAJ5012060.1 hypothetical protein K4K57_004758 [Colletotrichum sp. SAR 10_99]